MTTTQRRRKIATAQKRLEAALALLNEVHADIRDTPGYTTPADSVLWRAVVHAASNTEAARNTLADTTTEGN
jgi:hypothetical protein